MHIVVISHSYPTKKTIDFVFVDQLCRAFADQNIKISIIAPQSITKCLFRRVPLSRIKSQIVTKQGNSITLIRPVWFSLGSRIKFIRKSFRIATLWALRRIKDPIDVIYCHFWAQAIAALPFIKDRSLPLFVVAGEGELDTHKKMSLDEIRDVRNLVKGVICVATKSKNESVSAGFATEDMCKVFPNAIDPELFFQRDKQQMRAKLGFHKEDFIVAFVGQWNSRKGIKRLSEALTSLHNPNIKALFIGRGAEVPNYDHIIFQGTVNHDLLPEYLSSADIFVLPTNNEGCSNAVIEAMACGLPIVSSDMEFNWDVLNTTNSILLDPYDICAIASAIQLLYEDTELRMKLQRGALRTAAGLTLNQRAANILSFIRDRISNS